MAFDSWLNMQCKTVADAFVIAGRENWDSDSFAKQLFHTEWGVKVLKGILIYEYACPKFMYEGLKLHAGMKFHSGKVYQEDILWYSGYLYRYLIENAKDTPSTVYKKAPIRRIAARFEFYHTQDWDYVKKDLAIQ